MGKMYLYDIKDRTTGQEYKGLPLSTACSFPEIVRSRFAAWCCDRANMYGTDGEFDDLVYKNYTVSRKVIVTNMTGGDIQRIADSWEDAVRPFRELQKRRDARLWAGRR